MPYKILPTKEFEKDFKKLEKTEQQRIKNKIEEVGTNPERYKHLQY
jgi:mRNA-degrading endonuclease RelE of RelBE toxin-antitoxin system